MINGLEGIPGSGKSYEAVVYHVLALVKAGRKVITNLPLNVDMFAAINPEFRDLIEIRRVPQPIRGTWDSSAAGRDEPAFRLFANGEAYDSENPLVTLTDKGPVLQPEPGAQLFAGVWDFWTDWKGKDGKGPVFIIDECHIPLPKIGTKAEVIEWFKIHRHFNVDVLLMTQNFRDMCAAIASLIAMLVKVRKADILGKKDSYIRKVHAGYRGAVISEETRKYDPAYFPLYKSHTQGNSVAESAALDVSPFIVKFNRFKWVWLAGTAVYCVWAFWPSPAKPAKRVQGVATTWANGRPIAADVTLPARPARPASAASAPAKPASGPAPGDGEPLAGKGVHILGRLSMGGRVHESFVVSAGGARIFDISAEQLREAGYRWQRLSECAGVLTWGRSVSRMVTCDAPVLAQGSQNKPVVLAEPVPVGSLSGN